MKRIVHIRLIDINSTRVCISHSYKVLPSRKFLHSSHFLLCFFYFHCTLFVGLHDLGMNPGIFIQNTHLVCTYSTSLVCLNFFMDFNKICISISPIIGCLVELIRIATYVLVELIRIAMYVLYQTTQLSA